MVKLVAGLLPLLFLMTGNAQPVFSYGNKTVSKEEFLNAFNKNPSESTDRKKALKEYLNLYINFKLKVQAAYDEKLDKDPGQQFELENFKKQIADNIINEEAKIGDLVKEAFQRSQKDIHLAQVFVEFGGETDSAKALKTINEAYKALKEGKEFSKVAQEYSTDIFTKQNGGDMGFVTAFTLPYLFENIAYSLQAGNFSAPFKSKIGYHIFKHLGERKAMGTRRVAQILFALPPEHTSDQKKQAAATADSVYRLLNSGTPFDEMVKAFSNDINSVNNGGLLPEFGIGEFDEQFEEIAFALKTPDEISKPFASKYGYHIIKLIEARPVASDVNDPVYTAFLKDKVSQDDRLSIAKKQLSDKHLSLIKYTPAVYNAQELWKYTDSALVNQVLRGFVQVTDRTVLFSFAKQKITAADWVKFVKAAKALPSEYGQMSYPQLMKEYIKITGEEYYKNHLEEYNANYARQIKEFKEANLLFGIMDKNVWSKANTDTTALQQYYQKNKVKYQWAPGVDALIVTSPTIQFAKELQEKLKADSKNWKTIAESYEGKVYIDSGRFEFEQLAIVDRTKFTEGIATAPVRNESDGSYTFNLIIKVYNNAEQRSFEDAKGMVITDYQQVLEEKWINELKKKYPVKIYNAVL